MRASPMYVWFVFFLMIRRPPRSTLDRSSAASDVYKRQVEEGLAYLESQPDVEGLIFSTGGEALLTSGMGQFGERLDIIGNEPKNEWSNDHDQA